MAQDFTGKMLRTLDLSLAYPPVIFLDRQRKILLSKNLGRLRRLSSLQNLEPLGLTRKIFHLKHLAMPRKNRFASRLEHDRIFQLWSARADITKLAYGVVEIRAPGLGLREQKPCHSNSAQRARWRPRSSMGMANLA